MKVWQFIKKHYGEIISWVIGIAGLIATIFAAIKTEDDNFFIVYVLALVLESILTFIVIWHTKMKYAYEKEIDGLSTDRDSKLETIRVLEEQAQNNVKAEHFNAEDSLSTIILNIKNASKLNNDLCNRIPEISESSYATLETLQKGDVQDADLIAQQLSKSCHDFANSLYDLYKRYTSNLLSYIINMIKAYLHFQKIDKEISVSVKLFDHPLNSKEDQNNVCVYTAFRDKQTYDKHEREIGEEPYSISGNVDFAFCLRKDHYIMNNTKKGDGNYLNEHDDFDNYYNCAAVVPIRIKQVNSTYNFYGYVCCDCLNDNTDTIFTKESAQLLFSMAQLYATFLETLNSNWCERTSEIEGLPDHFLEVIYKKSFKGKEGRR